MSKTPGRTSSAVPSSTQSDRNHFYSRDYPTGEFEFIGRGAANYLELGEPTDILRALVDVPAGTQSLQIQMRLRNPDGEVIWSISALLP